MTIRPLGAELFHVDGRRDGQTEMTKLIVDFRNYANAPKWTKKEVGHPILFSGIKVNQSVGIHHEL